MQVTRLQDAVRRPRRVAVGEFDGVHLGHRAVIDDNDTALTFDPHPLVVVRPQAAPKLLTSFELRAEMIAALGVQELVVISFDERFAHQSPQEFIDHVLVERLDATHVSVGENFRFGFGASGDPPLLAADPRFTTRVVPLLSVDGEVVSSSRIRMLVEAGEMEAAARAIGVPFALQGMVVRGDRRGRELGFPTANIVPDPELVCPADGVYAATADGSLAAVNIGVRPTFGSGGERLVEAYLLDRDDDLYGRVLTLEFIARLRSEERFESVDALVERIRDDVDRVRELAAARQISG
jgi:riboflavin kinase/FMN adenylyltransferase